MSKELSEERKVEITDKIERIFNNGGFILMGEGHGEGMFDSEMIITHAHLVAVLMCVKTQFDELLLRLLSTMGMKMSIPLVQHREE